MKRLFLLALLISQLVSAKVVLRSDATHVEILGGTGAGSWKLVYGTTYDYAPRLLELSPERAYFAQGGWIRLIDTRRGVVLGRWHIGPPIVNLKPAGEEQAEAEVLDNSYRGLSGSGNATVLHDSVVVGPSTRVRLLPSETLAMHQTGEVEARFPAQLRFGLPKLAPGQARELLPAMEDMVRRDPLSPWLQVVDAYLLGQAGDPRAAHAFSQVLESEGSDFTEWLPIASYFYDAGKDDLAAVAYDRGYKDFLQRGYDARLMQSIFQRAALFAPSRLTGEAGRDLPPAQLERIYRLAPYPEFAWIIWQQRADERAAQGQPQQAQLWSERARDARRHAPALQEYFGLHFDRLLLVLLVFLPAVVIVVLVWTARYAPQRSADIDAGRRKWAIPVLSNLAYWTPAQRLALLLMVLAGWAAMGIGGVYAAGYVRAVFMPATPQAGIYTGPVVRWHFQNLPSSPERDLLLAITYQQSGDSRRAEDLYRKLPQFAASWNNLGVLLQRRGHGDEARESFQRALRVDPQLPEAAFNLDGSTPDLWTQLHRQYLPDRPMLALAPASAVQAAYRGGSSARFYLWSALWGPFWPDNAYVLLMYLNAPARGLGALPVAVEALWGALLLFALLGVLAMRRRRQVTHAPGPRHWIAELIFPGTSPAWSLFGGIVLLAWLSCWLALGLFAVRHSPWLLTTAELWKLRWFSRSEPRGLLNPSWLWFALPLVAIFVVNTVLVLLRRATSATTLAAGSGK